MLQKFTLLFCLALFAGKAFSQTADPRATVFASVASGSWANTSTWETYSTYAAAIAASPGSGTAATGVPSGTHNVLIRTGHTVTMGAANRGCKSLIVQSGGKLWAAETAARRLQFGQGGTGFVYPLTDTVQIDGVLGGSTDGIYIETGTNTQYVNLTGSGAIDIQRIRLIGGSGAAAGGALTFTIDANVNLWQASNYALTAIYSPAATDNYTLTINAGKTVTIAAATGYFNSNSGSAFGNYTYNINGTLDFTANTGTTGISQLQPLGSGSSVTLNVNGTVKAGSFTTSTNSGAAGALNLNINNGGLFDATTAAATYTFASTLPFATSGTGLLKRLAGGGTDVVYPLAANSTTVNNVTINNGGTQDNFSVNVKSTFDATPPASKRVNRQWTINEGTAGGTSATLKFSWTTADQTTGFTTASPVFVYHYNGSGWDALPATVSGSGTIADPYVATVNNVTAFSPFGVGNSPILPVSFTANKAYAKGSGVQVEWTTAMEEGVSGFAVERSTDGQRFVQVGEVASRNQASAYTWFDATPVAGINFYRIKTIEAGSGKYTAVMKVSLAKGAASFVIASNPVRNGSLTVQLSGMDKGAYALRVYNGAGQQVASQALVLEGASLSQTVALPALPKGIYTVQLANDKTAMSQKIVLE